MNKITIAGQPLHSVLSAAPAILIPFGFILDAMHSATGDEDYAKASYLSMGAGIVGGLAASVAGVADYVAEKPQAAEAKREGQLHAALTGAALLVGAANLVLRRQGSHARGGSLALTALSAAGVLASEYLGKRMSNDTGTGGTEHAEAGVHTDADKVRIDHTVTDVEQYVTAGPSTKHAPE
ncbi:DUF2231 domain-containing protein [Massilia sp. IC2-476]|uniref:DUF2231 domain-containing protein n=1 Tax=Massilia sp. IC2-476 TaxID=2887199 RepID=UPI001D11BB21|nr:DUF2231 domain-containing protein [Massilia sp. IC2-476]MCC2971615.1 DUF2231 domain-containing protein [Massilia sp. IC2-476]